LQKEYVFSIIVSMKPHKKNTKEAVTLFSKINSFLDMNGTTVFLTIYGIGILFSLLLFNLRISEGGDDSTYIIRAYNFLKEGAFPTFQGPLYPIFLSLVIGIFGISLGILKLTSLLFMALFLYLFYKAFKGRIEPLVLFFTVLLLSVNSYFLYFSSQTYSEAMFLALLGWFFVEFFKYIDVPANGPLNVRKILLLSAVALVLTLTKTIGAGVIIAAVIFFVVTKEYKKAGMLLLFFFLLLGAWLIFKGLIWGFDAGASSQANTLIYKHPYDFSKGKETFTGYLMRIVDNSNLYLSKHFLKMTGFLGPNSRAVNPFITVILYLLFVFTFGEIYRKNRYLTFTGIFVITMLGITFVSLQKIWDQYRLIVPFFPFMLLMLTAGILELFKKKRLIRFQVFAVLLMSLSFVLTAEQSFRKMDVLTLRSNLKGNKFKGYTDDWANYLRMAEYVGKHLGDGTYVACRKPNMARIMAGGKKFYGIYRVPTDDPDVLLQKLRENHVTHIIMASLRKNPMVNNGYTINTVKRYMAYIIKKYPGTFTLVHNIGKSEPAYLFKINYPQQQK
jgi:hypothetical protein